MKCSDIINFLNRLAPPSLAEDFDNVGLLVGSENMEVNRVMFCLDVTLDVVEEAVNGKADLIISHHPFIFKALKRVNTDKRKGIILQKLLKNEIGVFAMHTNLDIADGGLNDYLAILLGLNNIRNLNPCRAEELYKLVVYVPEEAAESVREAICSGGAGWLGNYSDCSFSSKGMGTFRPLKGTKPYIGNEGELERVSEYRLETVVGQDKLEKTVKLMMEAHPYEEVAYDIFPLKQKGREYGLGRVGELENEMDLMEFTGVVKKQLAAEGVRLIGDFDRKVKKVAVFSGSFDDNWSSVAASGADVLVTGDVRYHSAQEAEELGLCVIDAGHFATEHIVVPMLSGLVRAEFSGIDIISNNVERDPFKFC